MSTVNSTPIFIIGTRVRYRVTRKRQATGTIIGLDTIRQLALVVPDSGKGNTFWLSNGQAVEALQIAFERIREPEVL